MTLTEAVTQASALAESTKFYAWIAIDINNKLFITQDIDKVRMLKVIKVVHPTREKT